MAKKTDIIQIVKLPGKRTKIIYRSGEEKYANPREDVDAYIRSIRNKDKKEYAVRYAKWKLSGEKGEFPRAKNLSMMAEQSVFIQINKMLESKSNPRSRFRQLYQIKDSHGRVHSIVGGLKLAKSHAQRYADMFDESMRIEPYKWRG